MELPPLTKDHYPYPDYTKSHCLDSVGLFVFGKEHSFTTSRLSSELFSHDQWNATPTAVPHESQYFPNNFCSAQLNTTHIILMGGDNADARNSTWLLDTTNYSWTRGSDMLDSRKKHGCVTTSNNEVLILGGESDANSVNIYNPSADAWRQEESLPGEINHVDSLVLLLWQNSPTLLEHMSEERIWIRSVSGQWTSLEITLGAVFDGSQDLAITVPANLYECS